VLAAGAKCVVIVSGLLQSVDLAAATRAAKQMLEQNQSASGGSEIRIQK
jgi:thiamine monophosphate synthase